MKRRDQTGDETDPAIGDLASEEEHEGAGERATNAFERYPYAPNDLQALAELSGQVPTVAVHSKVWWLSSWPQPSLASLPAACWPTWEPL